MVSSCIVNTPFATRQYVRYNIVYRMLIEMLNGQIVVMNSAKRNSISQLISHVLQTTDERKIERFMKIAHDFANAPIVTSKPRPISYWERRWKQSIAINDREHMSHICRDFGNTALPIFRILHELRGTRTEPMLIKPKDHGSERRSASLLSESNIIADVTALLQGGSGERISVHDGKVQVKGCLTAPHQFAVSEIMKAVLCLEYITSTVAVMKGVIGQAIAGGLQAEQRAFVAKMTQIQAKETSLLSLVAFVQCSGYERLTASAYICKIVRTDDDDVSVLNSLALTQNHGNPIVQSIGHDLLEAGRNVIVEFIKDWVVYGRLDDPYDEFFITRSTGRVESWDWWNSKHVVVSGKIPLFLVDEELIAKIVSGGRAWNFVRKYKLLQSGIPSEGEFVGKLFPTNLITSFSDQAMKNAMKIMMDYVWVRGHLQTLNDFILFFRGDFASALFHTLAGERASEAINALLVPLKACTRGQSYTNGATGEKLTDRIDLQMKASYDEASMRLSYVVDSPLDFIFDPDSMANYRRLSQLIWKLKCCEFHLTSNWKRARHQTLLAIVGEDSGLSRKQGIVRHKMLTTVTAINEFISTDVVMCNANQLTSSLSSLVDIDTLILKHGLHIGNVMRGTLLTSDFIEHQNALGLLIETINKYATLEDEIESIIDRMLDEIENAENFDTDGDAYMQRINEELADASYQVSLVNGEFDEHLGCLHQLTVRKDAPNELRRLDLRLSFCFPQKTVSGDRR